MTTEATLQAALALLTKNDDTASSEDIRQALDDLDLAGAKAAIDALEENRFRALIRSTDSEIAQMDAGIAAAHRDLERRRAVAQALQPLIEDAEKREAEADLLQHGEDARLEGVLVKEDLVLLDKMAIEMVDLLNRIQSRQNSIANANARFRAAGRSKLLVGLPLDELSHLTNTSGEFLPRLDWFRLHGYTDNSEGRRGDAERRPYPASLRFGRLAELLPAATPSPETGEEARSANLRTEDVEEAA